jgi:hypothetical protein
MKSRSLLRHCFAKGFTTVALPRIADRLCPGKTQAFARGPHPRGDRPAALDAAISAGSAARSTLVIAHRLATLAGADKGADKIVVLQGGALAEEGRHAELMAKGGGVYRGLALAQQAAAR